MAITTTGAVNEALYYVLAISALLLVAIVFFMVLFLVRYRASRNPKATEIPGKPAFEVAVVAVSTLLALTFFWYGLTGYQFLRRVPQGALQIAVHAKQYAWSFTYPDGRVSPDLVVPVGSDVRCNITSEDVLHGFYVPAMRIQVDAVPRMPTYAWFKAKDIGVSDILCTVYCGTAHSSMMAKLYVLSVAEFQKWKAGEEIQLEGDVLPIVALEGQGVLATFGCLDCHSVDGTAKVGPSFKGLFGSKQIVLAGGVKKTVTADETFLRRSISKPHDELAEGFTDLMPDFDDILKREDLDEIVSAIKTYR
jgi:cytochrome c oxidase subunit 2